MSKAESAAPVISADWITAAVRTCCSTSAAAAPGAPTSVLAATFTPSNWRRAYRRTRSTLRSGVTVRPSAPAGTRNWGRPAAGGAEEVGGAGGGGGGDGEVVGLGPRLDGRLHAGEDIVVTVGLGAQPDRS